MADQIEDEEALENENPAIEPLEEEDENYFYVSDESVSAENRIKDTVERWKSFPVASGKKFASRDLSALLLEPSNQTLFGSSKFLRFEDYSLVKNLDLEEILENAQILSSKKKMSKVIHEKSTPKLVTPTPSEVPYEISDADLTDQSEINMNLHKFYLTDADRNHMPDKEDLLIYDNENLKTVGKLTICTWTGTGRTLVQIEGIKSDENEKIAAVYLFGWVTSQYIGLREFRAEQNWQPDQENFRSLHIVRLGKLGYHVSAKHGSQGDEVDEPFYIKMQLMKRVLTEAGMFLLIRKLAYSHFIGTLKLKCLYITGHICLTNLRVYYPRRMVMNQVAVDIIRIRRKVLCPSGLEETSNIFISTACQFVAQVYRGEPCRLQIDPASVLNPFKFITPERLVPLRLRYEDDPQVYSYFLDEVDRWSYRNKLYLHDHQEIYQVLSQLMKEFLVNKPHRVVAFAQNYFTRLL